MMVVAVISTPLLDPSMLLCTHMVLVCCFTLTPAYTITLSRNVMQISKQLEADWVGHTELRVICANACDHMSTRT